MPLCVRDNLRVKDEILKWNKNHFNYLFYMFATGSYIFLVLDSLICVSKTDMSGAKMVALGRPEDLTNGYFGKPFHHNTKDLHRITDYGVPDYFICSACFWFSFTDEMTDVAQLVLLEEPGPVSLCDCVSYCKLHMLQKVQS